MTNKQEDQISMWSATNEVLNNYDGKWNTIVAFGSAVNLFRKIREEVHLATDTQMKDNSGITQSKTAQRNELIEHCKQMALNIKAYAVDAGNLGLEKEYSFTPTYFEKLRDNVLPVIAASIYNKAVELKVPLADYGVDQDALANLETYLNNYKSSSPAPRLAKGRVKQATVDIAAKVKEATIQLNQMDNLIGNFNKQYPDFVAAFRNARMVIPLGARSKKEPTKQAPIKIDPR